MVVVLLWLPLLYPKSEVPDGGEPMARGAWESVWGRGVVRFRFQRRRVFGTDVTILSSHSATMQLKSR